MVSLNPVRILKNEADEEKAEVKRKKSTWNFHINFYFKEVVILSDHWPLAMMGKADSQWYLWNLYLIINLEDIAVF